MNSKDPASVASLRCAHHIHIASAHPAAQPSLPNPLGHPLGSALGLQQSLEPDGKMARAATEILWQPRVGLGHLHSSQTLVTRAQLRGSRIDELAHSPSLGHFISP